MKKLKIWVPKIRKSQNFDRSKMGKLQILRTKKFKKLKLWEPKKAKSPKFDRQKNGNVQNFKYLKIGKFKILISKTRFVVQKL